MDAINWNIPNMETIENRLQEIDTYLQNFPSGIIADILRKEKEALEKIYF